MFRYLVSIFGSHVQGTTTAEQATDASSVGKVVSDVTDALDTPNLAPDESSISTDMGVPNEEQKAKDSHMVSVDLDHVSDLASNCDVCDVATVLSTYLQHKAVKSTYRTSNMHYEQAFLSECIATNQEFTSIYL